MGLRLAEEMSGTRAEIIGIAEALIAITRRMDEESIDIDRAAGVALLTSGGQSLPYDSIGPLIAAAARYAAADLDVAWRRIAAVVARLRAHASEGEQS